MEKGNPVCTQRTRPGRHRRAHSGPGGRRQGRKELRRQSYGQPFLSETVRGTRGHRGHSVRKHCQRTQSTQAWLEGSRRKREGHRGLPPPKEGSSAQPEDNRRTTGRQEEEDRRTALGHRVHAQPETVANVSVFNSFPKREPNSILCMFLKKNVLGLERCLGWKETIHGFYEGKHRSTKAQFAVCQPRNASKTGHHES